MPININCHKLNISPFACLITLYIITYAKIIPLSFWVAGNFSKIVNFFFFTTCQCEQILGIWDPSYLCLKHFEYQLQNLDINKTLKFQLTPIKVKESRVKVDPALLALSSCMYAWGMGHWCRLLLKSTFLNNLEM